MDRNIVEISKALNKIDTPEKIQIFLGEIFSDAELADLSKRWRILNMLKQGITQREIAAQLNVSLCKITRGAKILKNTDAVCKEYLNKKGENNE